MYNEGQAVLRSKEKYKADHYFQQGDLSLCPFFELCVFYLWNPHIAALRGGVGIIPISQMRNLKPEVTQAMAELVFALGLVALKLMFLFS